MPEFGGVTFGAFLTTDTIGGIWNYSVDLANGMSAAGHRVSLATVGPAATAAQRAELNPRIQLEETRLPLDWLAGHPAELEDAAETLAGLSRHSNAALLHAPAFIGRADWPVPVAVMAHSCLTTWWRAVRSTPMQHDFAWRAAAAAAGYRRADAVAAPTAAFAELTRQTYSLRHVSVIHNGRTPHRVHADRQRAVLTAGRLWDDGKNAALLNRVAARLSAPLRAAGPLTGPAEQSAALPHLDTLGPLDTPAMARAYSSATVFASAALYEPFGLAILEAAQSGMALVLSDIPTLRELWDGAALFVPPTDEDSWVAALEAALAEPAAWAERARVRAERYSVTAMVDGTAELLASIAVMDAVPA